MSDVEQVLREYIREHRAGGDADPREYLTRVEDRGDRLELESLIDAYLEHAPRASVHVAAMESPEAEALVDRIVNELDAPTQTWRVLLPALRMQARLKREELVRRLTDALGVTGREQKVARYYNAMEHERLEPSGISEGVYEALASVVSTSVDALRAAAPRPRSDASEVDLAFARSAPWEADDAVADAAPSVADALPEPEWDEVDELFRGG